MKRSNTFDPTTLEIYRALYTSVAEEMGIALRRTAFSPNIKERRDYSCAVFDGAGQVIAQGDHMPVHLGSMPMAVRAAIEKIDFAPGDVVVLNDPFAGGTHLPDVTLISGVYANEKGHEKEKSRGSRVVSTIVDAQYSASSRVASRATSRPLFYVANRAHHADVGGASPGSMGMGRDVYAEGIRIPPLRIVRGGEIIPEVFELLMANVRASHERRADFEAQLGSLKTGAQRLLEICERSGAREALEYSTHLIDYAARLMRRTISDIPDGVYKAEDCLDDDGVAQSEVKIRVSVRIAGEHAMVDFTGSAPQVAGPLNAVEAITASAVWYVFRCLIDADDIPASAGLMLPIKVIAPPGTIVNALHPSPVAGGNVETSQRIVDVLLKALAEALPLKIPAASQGTMNNLTIGGIEPRTDTEFAYYETMAGGMGARQDSDGLSGTHTHMTNSLNTPIEALEFAYPLRVRIYRLREDSGGRGQTARGGNGLVREIETLVPARVSLLADRRTHAPYGLAGGGDGEHGQDYIVSGKNKRRIASKGSWELQAGERIRILTPGGGGRD